MTDQSDRIGDGHTDQFHRSGGHDHAQRCKQKHRQRQTENLPEDLILLALGITAEVRNVQRQRGPETDHCGQPGGEVTDHAGALRTFSRNRQQLGHRHIGHRPHQQANADRHQQRRGQGFQPLDRLGTANHHPQIQRPEHHEANHLPRAAEGFPALEHRAEKQVNRQPAKHRLNAEPATRHQCANQARHVGAENAERRAQQHRKRDAVLGAGESVKCQRNQHDDVGEQNRQQRFTDAQAEVRREHATEGISRHTDRHADPQRGDVPLVPGTFAHLGRCHVVVVTGTVEDVAAGFKLEQAVALGHLRSDLLHGRSTVLLIIFLLIRRLHPRVRTGRWPEELTTFVHRPWCQRRHQ
ncbi:hypothetical protein D3C87_1116470 [compost metagenome]